MSSPDIFGKTLPEMIKAQRRRTIFLGLLFVFSYLASQAQWTAILHADSGPQSGIRQ